ncbi:MAG: hypothetical protein WCJ88_11300 [Actinomycetes bacterium]
MEKIRFPQFRGLRVSVAALALFAAASMPLIAAQSATATPVDPAIDLTLRECTISFSPSNFGPTDQVTLSVTGAPAPVLIGIGIDNAGAAAATNGAIPISPYTIPLPGAFLAASFNLPTGAHTLQIYAWSGDVATGGATGSALCSTSFSYTSVAQPSFTNPSALPSGTIGTPYSNVFGASQNDASNTIVSCAVTGDVPGLTIAAAATPAGCPTLSGTPTVPGSYNLTGTITYSVAVANSGVGPAAVVELVSVSNFTLDIASAPKFTG